MFSASFFAQIHCYQHQLPAGAALLAANESVDYTCVVVLSQIGAHSSSAARLYNTKVQKH